jgi:hypothetical protein
MSRSRPGGGRTSALWRTPPAGATRGRARRLDTKKVEPVIILLDRFCAMVTRLGGLGAR